MILIKTLAIVGLISTIFTGRINAQPKKEISLQLEQDTVLIGKHFSEFRMENVKWFSRRQEEVSFLDAECNRLAEQIHDSAFTFLGIKAQRLFWGIAEDSTITEFYVVFPFTKELAHKITVTYGEDFWVAGPIESNPSAEIDPANYGSAAWKYRGWALNLSTRRNQLHSGDYDDIMVLNISKIPSL